MKSLLGIILLFLSVFPVSAQTAWYQKNLSFAGMTLNISMLNPCGTLIAFQDNASNICFNRYDCNETLLWTKCYTPPVGGNTPESMIQVDDGGFVLLSRTIAGSYQFMVITKFDSLCNVMWCKDFSTALANSMFSLVNSGSNTFITGGSGCTAQNTLLKIDAATGAIIWSNRYVGTVINMAMDIIKTSDSNYAVLAFSGTKHTGLYKIDGNGNVLWSHIYTFSNESWMGNLVELQNKDLLITCQSKSLDTIRNDITIQRTDSVGNLLFTKLVHHPLFESYGKNSAMLSTGEIVLIGDVFMGGSNPNLEGTIVKFNADLDSILFTNHNGNFEYSHLGMDTHTCIGVSEDDEIFIGGSSDGASLMKISSDGQGLCVNDTLDYQLLTIPANDTLNTQTKIPFSIAFTDRPMVTFPLSHFETIFCLALGVSETKEISNTFWPNPTVDFLHFDLKKAQTYSAKVYSLFGNYVGEFPVSEATLDCRFLVPGVYLVKLNSKEEERPLIKFVKM